MEGHYEQILNDGTIREIEKKFSVGEFTRLENLCLFRRNVSVEIF